MTDAPEHIWAGRWLRGGRAWRDAPAVHIKTEYIRADLVEAMEAENQRLREALAPFAHTAGSHCDDWMEDDYSPSWAPFFTCGDFRRARAALPEPKAGA